MKCMHSYPGTYGHPCGAPATVVGIMQSDLTVSGVYYAPRCESCRRAKTKDNKDIERWEPFDPRIHRNDWRGAANV